jgi:hypothetical protein
MNLEITTKDQYQLIEGISARIIVIERLIETFKSVELISMYVNEREELIELKTKLQSL